MKYLISLVILTVLLCGNGIAISKTSTNTTNTNKTTTGYTTQIITTSKFSAIKIEGNIDVDLHTGYKKSKIILKGNQKDLAYLKPVVKNETLILTVGKGYPHYGTLKLEIRTNILNSFTYKGTGSITGSKIGSGLLSLDINNNGKTTLNGYISLRSLTIDGKGYVDITGVQTPGLTMNLKGETKIYLTGMGSINSIHLNDKSFLSMYWVDAYDLHVWLRDKSYLRLAGIAEHLYADLCQESHFDGRHLRAKSSFVKTHDKALAEISSVVKQHTLAADNSDIYFYELPNMQANFMIFNGSVLDMRDINDPFFEEPTRYNKYP